MKMKLLFLVLILLFTVNAYADHTFSVTVTDEEYKTLQWQLTDPDKWVLEAIKNKINKSQERLLPELTDKRVNALTETEKTNLIKNSIIETRIERDKKIIK